MGLFNFSIKDDSVFGLDIGYETLKLVELSRKKNKVGLIGWIEAPITDRILEKDSFKNKSATANLIKEACRKAKPFPIKAGKIVSALPETFVFSKTIQLPKMTQAEYDKAVPTEAAQYLPIPVEEVYIDYQILIVHPDEPLADVLLVATPRKLVDEYVEVTKMAGFELAALETKPIAVGRAVSMSHPLEGIVVLEIGTEISRVSIWDNNNIRLITSVGVGKNQIAESLGFIGFNDDKLEIEDSFKEPSGELNKIADEVINAIKYHQNRDYKPKPVKKILICGSGAKIKGIDNALEKLIKVQTEIIKPRLDDRNTLGTEYITAYGLALRQEFN